MLEVAVVLLRWLQYGGAVVLLGAPLFGLYSFTGRDRRDHVLPRSPLMGAALVVALASFAGLSAQTGVMAGSVAEALNPASLGFVIRETALGGAMAARGVVALLALGALALLKPGGVAWGLTTGAGLVVAASFAWSGHAGAADGAGRYVHLAADAVHVIAAALWLGALAALTLLLSGRARVDEAALHRALHGFAGVGTLAVSLLVVTGLINSWFLVGAEGAATLGASPYGRLLLGKLALFGVMLVLAAVNRLRLTPALGTDLASGHDPESALGRLRRSVAAETLLGAALLGLVAVMGTLAPPSAG